MLDSSQATRYAVPVSNRAKGRHVMGEYARTRFIVELDMAPGNTGEVTAADMAAALSRAGWQGVTARAERPSLTLTWYSAGTEEPRDEQTDLMAGYWAVIGPKAEGRFSFTIVGPDGEDVTNGNADNADAAKAAVGQWFAQSVDYSTGRTTTPPAGWGE